MCLPPCLEEMSKAFPQGSCSRLRWDGGEPLVLPGWVRRREPSACLPRQSPPAASVGPRGKRAATIPPTEQGRVAHAPPPLLHPLESEANAFALSSLFVESGALNQYRSFPRQDYRQREEEEWWKAWREQRCLAAAKLQAAVRGRRVRKELRAEVRREASRNPMPAPRRWLTL